MTQLKLYSTWENWPCMDEIREKYTDRKKNIIVLIPSESNSASNVQTKVHKHLKIKIMRQKTKLLKNGKFKSSR